MKFLYVMIENVLSDFFLIILAWLMLSTWQLVAVPFLLTWFKDKLFDRGWAWGRLMIWLVISLVIWFLAHLGLPFNTSQGIWLVFMVLVLISYRLFQQNKKEILKFIRQAKGLILLEELLFFFGLVFLSLVRGYHPEILDLEKFMDAGFMFSYLKSSTLPAADMWLAGATINYYSFGQFLGAVVSHFWQIPLSKGYNLLLGMLLGLVLSQGFSLALNLLSPFLKPRNSIKPLLVAGLVAAFLLGFGGNSHAVWYLLTHRGMTGYWYPDATRFIDRTIHEYPAYSFVVSDLHAHVWSLVIVLLTILQIWLWLRALLKIKIKTKHRRWSNSLSATYLIPAGITGVLLGVLVMTSAWDAAIYSLLLAVIGGLLLLTNFNLFLPLFVSALLVIMSLVLTSSFWWLNFTSISQGVKWAQEHSPLWQLIVLWFGHVVGSSVVAGLAGWQWLKSEKFQLRTSALMLLAMIITAWILLVLPEFIYVKDIYPNHPRANTMFKLTFQAFLLMSVSIGWLAGFSQLKKYLQARARLIIKLAILAMIMAVGIYPFPAYRDYYGHFKDYQGLDGLAWLQKQHPNDYAGILWLQQNVIGQPHIVEAVGESYTTYARVSAFTGLPTVLGWRVHEWLWRGGFDIPGQRTEEVKKVYLTPHSADAQRILNQYQVKYIFVGDKEREKYKGIDVNGLQKLGQLVFKQGDTLIIARN